MAKGRKTGGRLPGVPNKVTQEGRALFLAAFERMSPDFEGWVRAAAETDPAKAAGLLVSLAEFALPKLARVEKGISDASDDDLLAEIRRRQAEQAP
jgi:hypothetical protein